jgi:hypothetical protein
MTTQHAPSMAEIRRSLDVLPHSGLIQPQRHLVENARSRAHRDDSSLHDPIGTQLLHACFSAASPSLKEEYLTKTHSYRLAVLGTDICNASAVGGRGDATILVHRGLIKCVTFYIELEFIVQALLTHAEDVAHASRDDMGKVYRLVWDASFLLVHYVRGVDLLPWLGSNLDNSIRSNVVIRVSHALWFIVMHEIGHIELGHLTKDGGAIPPIYPSLALQESLNELKAQEFAADAYVINSLRPDDVPWTSSYVIPTLEMLSDIETRLRALTDTHPLALNRLHHMYELLKATADVRATNAMQRSIDNQVKAWSFMSRLERAEALEASPEEAANALQTVVEIYASLPAQPSHTFDLERGEFWATILRAWWSKAACG